MKSLSVDDYQKFIELKITVLDKSASKTHERELNCQTDWRIMKNICFRNKLDVFIINQFKNKTSAQTICYMYVFCTTMYGLSGGRNENKIFVSRFNKVQRYQCEDQIINLEKCVRMCLKCLFCRPCPVLHSQSCRCW